MSDADRHVPATQTRPCVTMSSDTVVVEVWRFCITIYGSISSLDSFEEVASTPESVKTREIIEWKPSRMFSIAVCLRNSALSKNDRILTLRNYIINYNLSTICH